MAKHYAHLNLEDRCTIGRLHEGGQSIQKMAAALDRSASTIARELNRNHGTKVGYKPVYAQERAAARRWTGSRLERTMSGRRHIPSYGPADDRAIRADLATTPP